jgi:uncharacterized protein YecT (DUF1311 family)
MQFLFVSVISVAALIPVGQIHAQTQAAMNAQARAEFEKADAELNKTYEALLTKLPDDESKQKLKQSQRAWLAFRDAEAAFAADEARGGSMAPTLRYATMTELTQQRIKQLKTRLAEDAAPEEKDASAAKPLASSTAELTASAAESKGEQTKSVSETPEPTASSSPSSMSPDRKWEYKPPTNDRGPQIAQNCPREMFNVATLFAFPRQRPFF